MSEAKSLGGTVVMEATEVPQGTFGSIADNVGAIFSVIQLAPQS